MQRKPILCLDFDGVIHSYASGWKGPRCIPDPPVDGALEFLANASERFTVHIYSTRSNHWFGRRAIKQWLYRNLVSLAEIPEMCPKWMFNLISQTAFADPWDYEVRYAVKKFLKQIKFPRVKPPALVTIDDRAITFTGVWPDIASLANFKPWNKK